VLSNDKGDQRSLGRKTHLERKKIAVRQKRGKTSGEKNLGARQWPEQSFNRSTCPGALVGESVTKMVDETAQKKKEGFATGERIVGNSVYGPAPRKKKSEPRHGASRGTSLDVARGGKASPRSFQEAGENNWV